MKEHTTKIYSEDTVPKMKRQNLFNRNTMLT